MNIIREDVSADQLRTPPRGYKVRSPWMRNLLTFLMVFGPGLIVMEADNDAGAVSTYTQAGGQYGLGLLWVMLLLLPVCYFIQEMVVRLGIATGRGHAAMIYERFGKWWGRFSLFDTNCALVTLHLARLLDPDDNSVFLPCDRARRSYCE